mmetsp:Transcript_6901/g.24343  ORF Transcript_6901/g.24343 Transcript_6901/m.24343 type:complete len:245 (+) Transcript_6901:461-1195(+)
MPSRKGQRQGRSARFDYGADARAGGTDLRRGEQVRRLCQVQSRGRLRRRRKGRSDLRAAPRLRAYCRHAGPHLRRLGRRRLRLLRRRGQNLHACPRRGGPHARHGLRAPNPQGRGQVPRRPPDAVLHRDVAARGAQAGVGVSGQPRRDLRRRHFGRFKSQQGRDAKRVRHGRPRHVHEGPPLSGRGPPRDAGQRRDVRRPVPHHHLLQRQAPVRHAGAAAAAAGRHALRGHARRQGPDAADSDD